MKNFVGFFSFQRSLNILLVLNLVLFFSCKKEQKIPNCEEARKIAKSDFEKRKYIYYDYQYLTDDKSSNKEFAEILKKENINVIYKTKYPISDVIVPEEKIEESKKCYQIMMNYQLEAKFGNLFFDSARIESKKIHLQKLKIK